MSRQRWFGVLFVLCVAATSLAQENSQPTDSAPADSLPQAVRELRDEVRELRATIAEMRSD